MSGKEVHETVARSQVPVSNLTHSVATSLRVPLLKGKHLFLRLSVPPASPTRPPPGLHRSPNRTRCSGVKEQYSPSVGFSFRDISRTSPCETGTPLPTSWWRSSQYSQRHVEDHSMDPVQTSLLQGEVSSSLELTDCTNFIRIDNRGSLETSVTSKLYRSQNSGVWISS